MRYTSMQMKNWIGPLFFVFLLGCTACGPTVIYQKQQDIDPAGWAYADTLQYPFDIADTSGLYNLFLTLDHRSDFATQNLYVRVHTGFPNGQRLSHRLSLEISDKIGRALGDCQGELCQLDIPIQANAYFDQVGPHYFTLEQFMRTDSLAGIQSVSFRVELAQQER